MCASELRWPARIGTCARWNFVRRGTFTSAGRLAGLATPRPRVAVHVRGAALGEAVLVAAVLGRPGAARRRRSGVVGVGSVLLVHLATLLRVVGVTQHARRPGLRSDAALGARAFLCRLARRLPGGA